MEQFYTGSNVKLSKVIPPDMEELLPVALEDATFESRKNSVLDSMKTSNIDALVIYADLEHGSNFEYLTGFVPRFEEALLILHQTGEAYLLLGNENLKMASHARIKAQPVHVPYFSLPNQPMEDDCGIKTPLRQAGILAGMKIGLVGWKYFSSNVLDNAHVFDLPYYITKGIMELAADDNSVINATGLFINPAKGCRTINNANEIAHYEFGSALSGINILNAQNALKAGQREMDLANTYISYGQRHSVVSICATGERYEKANLYPNDKIIKTGDRISLTVGYKGGLTSRAGYAVKDSQELPEKERSYLDSVAKPYFAACAVWLEQIHIGMEGQELYDLVEKVLPKSKYHWTLNPGHLTSDEEWLSSPIYPNSRDLLKSGMLIQLDIIPSVSGYSGANCESGIALADEKLKQEIMDDYPQLWRRLEARKSYIKSVLNIRLNEDVLPLSCLTGYYRPFFLDKEKALVISR